MCIASNFSKMARKSCSIDVHDVFGPTVARSCLNGFDFTLLFEESVLTLLPLLFTGMDTAVFLSGRSVFSLS